MGLIRTTNRSSKSSTYCDRLADAQEPLASAKFDQSIVATFLQIHFLCCSFYDARALDLKTVLGVISCCYVSTLIYIISILVLLLSVCSEFQR